MTKMAEIGEADVVPDLGGLADNLGLLLRLGQLAAFDDFFAVLGDEGVRPGEVTVMMVIAGNPGIRQGAVSRLLKIKRAHMTKMVQAMAAAGLLVRTVPDDDRRSVELRLTAAGLERVAGFRTAFEEIDRRITRDLTRREVAELAQLLKKIAGLTMPGAEGKP